MGFFGNIKPASAQLRCRERRYELRLTVNLGAENSAGLIRTWRKMGLIVSRDALDSAPVDVHVCDDKFRTLRAVPFEPMRPDLPVRVTFRPSFGGGSLVARYRNDSDKYLGLTVRLGNATVGQSKSFTLTIPARGVTEHGWAEEWSYLSGETIVLSEAGHEPLEVVVP